MNEGGKIHGIALRLARNSYVTSAELSSVIDVFVFKRKILVFIKYIEWFNSQ